MDKIVQKTEDKKETVVAVQESKSVSSETAAGTNNNGNTKHIEFTKILTGSIVLMYVLNWGITWAHYFFTGNVSVELKEYLDVPLNVIMAGYLTKSGVENVLIKK